MIMLARTVRYCYVGGVQNVHYYNSGPYGLALSLHFMICHSNKCHSPAPQAVTKNSEVERNTGKLRHHMYDNICLDMRSSS